MGESKRAISTVFYTLLVLLNDIKANMFSYYTCLLVGDMFCTLHCIGLYVIWHTTTEARI